MNLVPFRSLYEEWAEAAMPDGTVIRFRGTLTGLLDNGPGSMQLRCQPQMQVFAKEDKQRAPRPQTKRLGPVDGVVGGTATSSYEHANGTMRIFTTLGKVFRTDGFDANNEPIFEIQFNQNIQLTPNGQAPPPVTPPEAARAQ